MVACKDIPAHLDGVDLLRLEIHDYALFLDKEPFEASLAQGCQFDE